MSLRHSTQGIRCARLSGEPLPRERRGRSGGIVPCSNPPLPPEPYLYSTVFRPPGTTFGTAEHPGARVTCALQSWFGRTPSGRCADLAVPQDRWTLRSGLPGKLEHGDRRVALEAGIAQWHCSRPCVHGAAVPDTWPVTSRPAGYGMSTSLVGSSYRRTGRPRGNCCRAPCAESMALRGIESLERRLTAVRNSVR